MAPAPREVTRPGSAHAHAAPLAFVWAALCAVYLIWGSTYLAIAVAIETLPPMLKAGVRFLLAGAILLGWSVARGDARDGWPGARQWRAAAVVGGALLLGGNGGVVWAEQHIPSGTAALLVATVPLWMAALAWGALRERISPRAVAGLVAGFAGVALLVAPEADLGGGRGFLGMLIVLAAALSWAAGSLYARRAPLPERPLLSTAMQMLLGGALLALAGLAGGEAGRIDLAGVSLRSALAFGYLVVFGSLVGFTAYAWLLRVTSVTLVSTYAYVNPVVAVLLGWAILAEPLGARTLVAGAAIIGSVALIVTSRPPESAIPATPGELAAGEPALRRRILLAVGRGRRLRTKESTAVEGTSRSGSRPGPPAPSGRGGPPPGR